MKSFQSYYVESVCARGPFVEGDEDVEAFDADDEWQLSKAKTSAVKLINARKFIEDQGSFVRDLLLALPEDEMAYVVTNVASLFINAIKNMGDIVAERDSRN